MNLKRRNLWCVEIDLPGSLKHPGRAVKWLCYFNSLPTKKIILAAIEAEIDCLGNNGIDNLYTRLFESVSFWDGAIENAQIMVAGTSIGQVIVTKLSPYFEANWHLKRGK